MDTVTSLLLVVMCPKRTQFARFWQLHSHALTHTHTQGSHSIVWKGEHATGSRNPEKNPQKRENINPKRKILTSRTTDSRETYFQQKKNQAGNFHSHKCPLQRSIVVWWRWDMGTWWQGENPLSAREDYPSTQGSIVYLAHVHMYVHVWKQSNRLRFEKDFNDRMKRTLRQPEEICFLLQPLFLGR